MPRQARTTWVMPPDGDVIYRRVWEAGTFPALSWWQARVEGYIELVPGSANGLYAYVNDEGMFTKPANTLFTTLWIRFNGYPQQMMHGTAVLVTGMKLECVTCEEITDDNPGDELSDWAGLDAIIRAVCPDAPG